MKIRIRNKYSGVVIEREYNDDYVLYSCGILRINVDTMGEIVDTITSMKEFDFSWTIENINSICGYTVSFDLDSDRHSVFEILE